VTCHFILDILGADDKLFLKNKGMRLGLALQASVRAGVLLGQVAPGLVFFYSFFNF